VIHSLGRVTRPAALVLARDLVEGAGEALVGHGRHGRRRRETTPVPAKSKKPRPSLPGGPYLVVGLARSGQAVARLLASRGEEVIGTDSGSPEGAEGLRGAGVEINLDGDGVGLLDRVHCVVKSPGVPGEAPVIAAARERELPVMSELELAWRLLPNRFVGVTGTNGKTTVTELLGEIWRAADEPVAVAGNVGTPLSSLVGAVEPAATVVCECSSFQLEDADAFAPECALLLNLAPDHLDRHGNLESYAAAKLRIFANQGPDDVAILDPSEPGLAGLEPGGEARRVSPDTARELVDSVELRLLGDAGRRNAMAAAAAAQEMGVGEASIRAAIEAFAGVPHRLEALGEIAGVRYVNDSKATNVAAAIAALEAFEGGVHAILGGSSKGESFEALVEPVAARCVACYLIGETAADLARDLEPAARAGVAIHRSGDLATAVAQAAAAANPGDVVLLAPASASFDAFKDFEERGDRFRALIEELQG
jgi:UDP-N-acetylmuramoylalanine--D-glutamate ligase